MPNPTSHSISFYLLQNDLNGARDDHSSETSIWSFNESSAPGPTRSSRLMCNVNISFARFCTSLASVTVLNSPNLRCGRSFNETRHLTQGFCTLAPRGRNHIGFGLRYVETEWYNKRVASSHYAILQCSGKATGWIAIQLLQQPLLLLFMHRNFFGTHLKHLMLAKWRTTMNPSTVEREGNLWLK